MWPTQFKLMLNYRTALEREDTPFLVGFHGFFDKSNNISKEKMSFVFVLFFCNGGHVLGPTDSKQVLNWTRQGKSFFLFFFSTS